MMIRIASVNMELPTNSSPITQYLIIAANPKYWLYL